MNASFRSTATVIALTAAALAPSLAHAKRLGGGKPMQRAAWPRPHPPRRRRLPQGQPGAHGTRNLRQQRHPQRQLPPRPPAAPA
jgi:acetyl-CoA decarbonylase/synthase complex subunit delta